MTGFIVGMAVIVALVLLGEHAWVQVVHRMEKHASDDTSWSDQ